MSLTERLERWGKRYLTGIIAVGIGASLVCMFILPGVAGRIEGCTIGALLFFACCFYLYVRATVR
jgi:hypothetical protein